MIRWRGGRCSGSAAIRRTQHKKKHGARSGEDGQRAEQEGYTRTRWGVRRCGRGQRVRAIAPPLMGPQLQTERALRQSHSLALALCARLIYIYILDISGVGVCCCACRTRAPSLMVSKFPSVHTPSLHEKVFLATRCGGAAGEREGYGTSAADVPLAILCPCLEALVSKRFTYACVGVGKSNGGRRQHSKAGVTSLKAPPPPTPPLQKVEESYRPRTSNAEGHHARADKMERGEGRGKKGTEKCSTAVNGSDNGVGRGATPAAPTRTRTH